MLPTQLKAVCHGDGSRHMDDGGGLQGAAAKLVKAELRHGHGCGCDGDARSAARDPGRRATCSSRSPSGSSAATAGPTISVTAVWITFSPCGEDVNVLVIDTEVYSNTGGQASKATPTGCRCQVRRCRQAHPEEGSWRDGHELRLRLRRAGRDGRRSRISCSRP